jgi:hypothetical protein
VVAAFEALLAGADEDYRLARGVTFQLIPVESESRLATAISA